MIRGSRRYQTHFRLTKNELDQKENTVNDEQDDYAGGAREGHGGRSMERTDDCVVGFYNDEKREKMVVVRAQGVLTGGAWRPSLRGTYHWHQSCDHSHDVNLLPLTDANLSVASHTVPASSIAFGAEAYSRALVLFGIQSIIEVTSEIIVLWSPAKSQSRAKRGARGWMLVTCSEYAGVEMAESEGSL